MPLAIVFFLVHLKVSSLTPRAPHIFFVVKVGKDICTIEIKFGDVVLRAQSRHLHFSGR